MRVLIALQAGMCQGRRGSAAGWERISPVPKLGEDGRAAAAARGVGKQ
jgi:hypothetical protein